MTAEREVPGEAARRGAASPAAAADGQEHVTQQIAGLEAHLARQAVSTWRWLAAVAGALAGWLILIRRRRGKR
jgi:hypothetical protein